ncbi:MAG: MBL fold metallo-hydrolase [Clostridia bacterium]|nr:MBL fold metallo-hydrolase [Clostridia bacterium]
MDNSSESCYYYAITDEGILQTGKEEIRMDFVSRVKSSAPPEGQFELFWLGQAGFVCKTAGGKLIVIDPYFSDYVQRIIPEEGLGFKRLSPPPCNADDLSIDALIISHEHGDHFDVDAMPLMLKNERMHVYTNKVVYAELLHMKVPETRLHLMEKGMSLLLWEELRLTAVDCDHGDLTPEALGFILDFSFTKVYYAGDTAYSPDRLEAAIQAKPEVALLPINGAYGNLNGITASRYAALLQSKVCVPCHFWTFPLHNGDPQEIIENLPKQAKNCSLQLLCQGEGFRYGSASV